MPLPGKRISSIWGVRLDLRVYNTSRMDGSTNGKPDGVTFNL
jgi:hypothetical protein